MVVSAQRPRLPSAVTIRSNLPTPNLLRAGAAAASAFGELSAGLDSLARSFNQVADREAVFQGQQAGAREGFTAAEEGRQIQVQGSAGTLRGNSFVRQAQQTYATTLQTRTIERIVELQDQYPNDPAALEQQIEAIRSGALEELLQSSPTLAAQVDAAISSQGRTAIANANKGARALLLDELNAELIANEARINALVRRHASGLLSDDDDVRTTSIESLAYLRGEIEDRILRTDALGQPLLTETEQMKIAQSFVNVVVSSAISDWFLAQEDKVAAMQALQSGQIEVPLEALQEILGENLQMPVAPGQGNVIVPDTSSSNSTGTVTGSVTIDQVVQALRPVENAMNDPRAVSHAGAIGLMQVTVGAAREVIPELAGSTDAQVKEWLYNEQNNINAGTAYLAAQIEAFDGDLDAALIAYNAGPARARRYMTLIESGHTREEALAEMPRETRNYVPKVRANLEAAGVISQYNVQGGMFEEPAAAINYLSSISMDRVNFAVPREFREQSDQFYQRLAAAIQHAATELGIDPPADLIRSGYRTPEHQAQSYADGTGRTITYNGVTYSPQTTNRFTVAKPPGFEGAPGSRHQRGIAADLNDGPIRQWLRENRNFVKTTFGLEFLRDGLNDYGHIQLVTDGTLPDLPSGSTSTNGGNVSLMDLVTPETQNSIRSQIVSTIQFENRFLQGQQAQLDALIEERQDLTATSLFFRLNAEPGTIDPDTGEEVAQPTDREVLELQRAGLLTQEQAKQLLTAINAERGLTDDEEMRRAFEARIAQGEDMQDAIIENIENFTPSTLQGLLERNRRAQESQGRLSVIQQRFLDNLEDRLQAGLIVDGQILPGVNQEDIVAVTERLVDAREEYTRRVLAGEDAETVMNNILPRAHRDINQAMQGAMSRLILPRFFQMTPDGFLDILATGESLLNAQENNQISNAEAARQWALVDEWWSLQRAMQHPGTPLTADERDALQAQQQRERQQQGETPITPADPEEALPEQRGRGSLITPGQTGNGPIADDQLLDVPTNRPRGHPLLRNRSSVEPSLRDAQPGATPANIARLVGIGGP